MSGNQEYYYANQNQQGYSYYPQYSGNTDNTDNTGMSMYGYTLQQQQQQQQQYNQLQLHQQQEQQEQQQRQQRYEYDSYGNYIGHGCINGISNTTNDNNNSSNKNINLNTDVNYLTYSYNQRARESMYNSYTANSNITTNTTNTPYHHPKKREYSNGNSRVSRGTSNYKLVLTIKDVKEILKDNYEANKYSNNNRFTNKNCNSKSFHNYNTNNNTTVNICCEDEVEHKETSHSFKSKNVKKYQSLLDFTTVINYNNINDIFIIFEKNLNEEMDLEKQNKSILEKDNKEIIELIKKKKNLTLNNRRNVTSSVATTNNNNNNNNNDNNNSSRRKLISGMDDLSIKDNGKHHINIDVKIPPPSLSPVLVPDTATANNNVLSSPTRNLASSNKYIDKIESPHKQLIQKQEEEEEDQGDDDNEEEFLIESSSGKIAPYGDDFSFVDLSFDGKAIDKSDIFRMVDSFSIDESSFVSSNNNNNNNNTSFRRGLNNKKNEQLLMKNFLSQELSASR